MDSKGHDLHACGRQDRPVHNCIDDVVAENIALRCLVACGWDHSQTGTAAADLDRLLEPDRLAIRRAVADGGLPAAQAWCVTRVDGAAGFATAAYRTYLTNVALQAPKAEPATKAVARLIADTILARSFLAAEFRRGENAPDREHIIRFRTLLKEQRLEVAARLEATGAGESQDDSVTSPHADAEPWLAAYAGALTGGFDASVSAAILRQHWADTIIGGGLDTRPVRRFDFGRPPRLLTTPLVFEGEIHEGADVRLRIDAPGQAGSARVFLAIGARDVHRRFVPLRWSTTNPMLAFVEHGPLLCSDVVVRDFWVGRVQLTAPPDAVEIVCCLVPVSHRHDLRVWSQIQDHDQGWIQDVPDDLCGWLTQQVDLARRSAQTAEESEEAAFRRQVHRGWQGPISRRHSPPLTEHDEIGILAEAAASARQGNLDQAIQHLTSQGMDADGLSHCLVQLADTIAGGLPEAALRLYWVAHGVCPATRRGLRIAAKMFQAGNITSAGMLARNDGPVTTRLRGELRLAAHLHRKGPKIPPRPVRQAAGPLDRVAYVASSAQPFQVTGYTVRTQQLLSALKDGGTSVTCFVRPGYPHDRAHVVQAWPRGSEGLREFTYTVGTVPYRVSWVPGVETEPEHFVERMADRLVQQFQAYRPSVVQAASNYRNALPALIAARRLGLPFVYEVRGLWELTAASRRPGWEETERFHLDREMEIRVAAEADLVLTITRGVAAELANDGVSEDRIALLPNAVDPNLFRPLPRDRALAAELRLEHDFTLVYAGSLTVYEGLDDLIEAVGLLRQDGIPASLVIIGDGVAKPSLEQLVRSRGLQACVRFLGRIAPDRIATYLSLADAVALPRKPYRVCQIISPLKPFEAMAMGKPVILTDLPVLREIVQDGRTGLICNPDDPKDLAHALRCLAENPALGRALGEAARRWVVKERSWSANADLLKDLYAQLTN